MRPPNYRKHYREYLVSLINDHSVDPAPLFEEGELEAACRRYRVTLAREEAEDGPAYHARLLEVNPPLRFSGGREIRTCAQYGKRSPETVANGYCRGF